MRENHIRMLCSVLKVEMVYEGADGGLTPFFDPLPESVLLKAPVLLKQLREGFEAQGSPFLHRAPHDCYYAALRAGEGHMYMGPMCHMRLSTAQARQMYRAWGIDSDGLRRLKVFTLPEIRNMVLLTNSALENANLENEELLQLNRIISQDERRLREDQTRFVVAEEAVNDEESHRHGYFEEKLLMQAIREGRSEDAVRLAEAMDSDSGRLSTDYLRHRRNLAIIGIALCARAAIEGGVSPETAYRVSGYYIERCDVTQDAAYMLHYRNRAIQELAGRVWEKRAHAAGSRYVAQARDYIQKHYREDIRLTDLAERLGLSPQYLSRLFHQQTGETLQVYIVRYRVSRAADLLAYSEMTLPEISVYVHFPNQSYFTRMFKRHMGTTPLAYRNRHGQSEI